MAVGDGVAAAGGALAHAQEVHRRRWWSLVVLCLSLFIVSAGNASLNVALPTLSRDLHASASELEWVVAVYSLVFAGLLFSAGAIGDRFGRKGALQGGLLVFLLAAALASQGTEMWQLIAGRALMGLGAAFIMPSTLSILVNIFPPAERSKAIAIWAATTGVSGLFGPLATGVLLAHFWYGSLFLVNVPVIAIALVGGWFLVPKSRDPHPERLDLVGAGLSILGIAALVYALIEAPDKGWAAPATLATFGFAAVVLVLFVMWERRVKDPMLDIRFFANPGFSTGSGGMLMLFLSMYGVFFLLAQYFQLVLGFSPLGAAVRTLPVGPVMVTLGPLTPRLSRRVGAHRVVAFGFVLVALSLLWFGRMGLHTSYLSILVGLLLLACGVAMAIAPTTATIMSAVPMRRAGAGSSMNDTTREVGAALGVAVLGSIAASRYSASLRGSLSGLSGSVRAAATTSLSGALSAASRLGPAASRALLLAARSAYIDGVHEAALIGGVLAMITAMVIYRYMPHTSNPRDSQSPLEAAEIAAELGLGGAPPPPHALVHPEPANPG